MATTSKRTKDADVAIDEPLIDTDNLNEEDLEEIFAGAAYHEPDEVEESPIHEVNPIGVEPHVDVAQMPTDMVMLVCVEFPNLMIFRRNDADLISLQDKWQFTEGKLLVTREEADEILDPVQRPWIYEEPREGSLLEFKEGGRTIFSTRSADIYQMYSRSYYESQ